MFPKLDEVDEEHVPMILVALVTVFISALAVFRFTRGNNDASTSSTPVLKPGKTFLDKTRKSVPLMEKIELSHDTRLFRFQLPEPNAVLGLPVGKHFKIWCPNPGSQVEGEWNGREDKEKSAEIERKYTPTSGDDHLGIMDMVIKVYRPNDRFCDGGKVG